MAAPSPSVCVVIACRNAQATLSKCLEALLGAESARIDPLPTQWRGPRCIVVDDASTDDSAAIAEAFGVEVVRLQGRVGPAKARNIGAQQATEDLLVFLDADVRVHTDTLLRISESFASDPQLDALIGSYDDTPGVQTFVSQYRNLLHCFTHQHAEREASTFWCGCGAIRRTVFLRQGGIPESYDRPSIEDIEFGYELKAAGARIELDPAIQVTHWKRWTVLNTICTDVFHRAAPWTRLILRTGGMPVDLGLRWDQRISVMLAFLAVAFALLSPLLSIACFIAIAVLNRELYSFLASRRGVRFALTVIPMHYLYFLCCGAGSAIGVAGHLLSRGRSAIRELTGAAEA